MDEEGIMYLAFCLIILLIAVSLTPYIGRGIIGIFAFLLIALGAVVIVGLNFADFLLVSLACERHE